MRRLIGPVILAILIAASLWFLQSGPENPTSQTPPSPAPAATSPLAPASMSATPPATPNTPSSSQTATSMTTPTISAAQPAPEGEGTQIGGSATVTPRDSAQAHLLAGYEKAAGAFMSAFARPITSVSADQWWSAVRPHLTATAAADYSGTDPQQVPFTRVTGPPSIIPTDAPTSVLVAVRVPTDAGTYRVELQTDADGIHVARAFPEEAGTPR